LKAPFFLKPTLLRATFRTAMARDTPGTDEVFMGSASRTFPFVIIDRVLLIVLFSAGLSVPTATAQSKTEVSRGVVLQDAPIFLTPDAGRTPLRVVAVGTNLEVLGTENGWLNIRFQDPVHGQRVGYIEAKAVRQETPAYLQPLDLTPVHLRQADLSILPTYEQASDPARVRVSSPTRQGMWGNIGIGFGSLGCQDCYGDRVNELVGDGSIGWTLSPRVRLGIGSSAYAKSVSGPLAFLDESMSISLTTVDARLRFHPKATSGFFITGGLGVGILRLKDSISYNGAVLATDRTSDVGAGAVMGIGWDIGVSKHVSITPSYTGFVMASPAADANVAQLGIGITIH
jgi:hypothetical protein